jgi:hypothetical protein
MSSGAGGAISKAGFVLTQTSYWKLAGFAKACGLTREQAANYDPDRESSHRMLLRKRLQVYVIKKGDYHEVDDWANINENVSDTPTPTDPRLTQPQAPEPAAAPIGKGIPF